MGVQAGFVPPGITSSYVLGRDIQRIPLLSNEAGVQAHNVSPFALEKLDNGGLFWNTSVVLQKSPE